MCVAGPENTSFMCYIFYVLLIWDQSFRRFTSMSWIMFLITTRIPWMIKAQQIQHQHHLPVVCFYLIWLCSFLLCILVFKISSWLLLFQLAEILEEKKYKDRLRLWQVFFASPYEWWDNRQHKLYVRSPDFKHKDTHEKLWLHPDDPPWVRKQLELIDQQTAEIGHRDGRGRLTNPRWNAQDFNYSDDGDEWNNDEQEIRRQANGWLNSARWLTMQLVTIILTEMCICRWYRNRSL